MSQEEFWPVFGTAAGSCGSRLFVRSSIRCTVPGTGVGEVEAAGAVEGLCGGPGWLAGGQVAVLVIVVAGAVDGEVPRAGVAYLAQAAQRQLWSAGQLPGDIGELAAETDGDVGKVGPAFAGAQLLSETGLGR